MRKFVFIFLMLLGIGVASAGALAIYTWDYFTGAGPLQQEAVLVLPAGTGFKGIVAQLEQGGVIDKPILFQGAVALLGQARSFKAGEYKFTPGMSPKAVAQLLASGKVVVHKITVTEGMRTATVLEALKSEPLLTGELPAAEEGSIMPETYHFQRGEARSAVLARMQQAMSKLVGELWEKRREGLPLKNVQEAVTLASIVEKETGVAAERGHVASVFVNRLRIGMRLQSDPTVVYGMEKAMGAPLGRALTSLDLQTETPYNTYTIAGLPPAPIANPGKEALAAVMNPPDTPDLYFVATGTGGHRFAASLDEHNSNVAQYRRALRQAKD